LFEKDKKYMKLALEEAMKAKILDEVPVGCIITCNNEVIARSHNKVESENNSTSHAELNAILIATRKIGSKYLANCKMYVTLEPCSMCAGAIVLSKIDELFIAASDNKSGASGSVFNITNSKLLNHRVKVVQGIMEEESKSLLQIFFKEKRV
jgi:tRNA(adenine34) deaminase